MAEEINKRKLRRASLPYELPGEIIDFESEKKEKRRASRKRITGDKSSKKSFKKNILKYIIIAVLVLAGIYTAVNIFIPEGKTNTTGNTVKQIELENGGAYDFELFGKNIVLCNQSGITAYDKKGNEKWKVDTVLYNPLIYVHGDNMLVTDSAHSSAMVIGKNGKIKTNIDFGAECIAASVNENGWTSAILSLKGYKAQVAVFDNNGKLKYTWNSANNDVISAELAGDNKTLAVVQLDSSSSVEANGVVSLFDITTEGKPYSGINTEGNIVTYIRWSGKNLICLGNKAIFKIDKNGKNLWTYEYPGDMVIYNAESDKVFAFAVNSNTTASVKSTIIYTVSGDGKELGNTEIIGDIKNIEVSDSTVSAITSDKIITLKKNAAVKSECSLNRDVSNGYLLDGGSSYLVVSGTSAEFLALK
ncbi:MAG: hypothetical protein IJ264_06765 [Clostridia bacterium]|nr:hypothetical protein [Clostridia bacterium]